MGWGTIEGGTVMTRIYANIGNIYLLTKMHNHDEDRGANHSVTLFDTAVPLLTSSSIQPIPFEIINRRSYVGRFFAVYIVYFIGWFTKNDRFIHYRTWYFTPLSRMVYDVERPIGDPEGYRFESTKCQHRIESCQRFMNREL